MLQLTYELRPTWNNNKNNKNKTQNAVSRSDPLQGSDNNLVSSSLKRISTVGPKMWVRSVGVISDQFLDHLTVIIISSEKKLEGLNRNENVFS